MSNLSKTRLREIIIEEIKTKLDEQNDINADELKAKDGVRASASKLLQSILAFEKSANDVLKSRVEPHISSLKIALNDIYENPGNAILKTKNAAQHVRLEPKKKPI